MQAQALWSQGKSRTEAISGLALETEVYMVTGMPQGL